MGAYAAITVANNSGPGNGSTFEWPGGIGTFEAVGTWGGGNAKLQALGPDGSTYVDLTEVVLDANGAIGFEYGRSTMRCVITTATAVYAAVKGVSPAW